MGLLYAGLDGGGTKTAVRLMDKFDRERASFTAPGINYTGVSPAVVEAALDGIFLKLRLLCEGDTLAAVCICAAGVSGPGVPERLQVAVRRSGYTGPLRIEGDHVGALAGALGTSSGAILLAGTGSICYGRIFRNGRLEERRTGGWGHIMGDEGSGYAIGQAILRAVARSADGREPPTCLIPLVHEALGTDSMSGILARAYAGKGKQEIAALAPLLDQAYAREDAAALAIAREAAEELALLTVPVVERLGLSTDRMALSGSILEKCACVRGQTLQCLAARFPSLACVSPKADAAAGAALLAMEL